jgi:hypothetical protein
MGLIQGTRSDVQRLKFWLRHIRQGQAYDWSQA